MLSSLLPVLLVLASARKVLSLKCYTCDNSLSLACGTHFKAYQFDAKPCNDVGGVPQICGKQVQPLNEDGWVGVIRSCYTPGDVPGLNASNGCQYHHQEERNFTALYCFCDTDNCNGSTGTHGQNTALLTAFLGGLSLLLKIIGS